MTLVTIIVTFLLYLQYHQAKEIAIYSVTKKVASLLHRLDKSIQDDATLTKKILESQSHYNAIKQPISLEYNHPSMLPFVEFLEIKSSIHSIYFVHSDGAFYEVVNLKNLAQAYKKEHNIKAARWAIIVKKGSLVRVFYLDSELKVLKSESLEIGVDLTQREWYKEARGRQGSLVITQPYTFGITKDRGITFALAKKGIVIAVDYAVEQLNTKLKSISHDSFVYELFVLDKEGRKFATSQSMRKTNIPALRDTIQGLYNNNSFDTIVSKNAGNQEYLISLHRYGDLELYMGAIIATKSLYAPYKESLLKALTIGLILLFFALFLVYFFTSYLVRPLETLTKENKKVALREFESVKPIESSIIEFKALSNSLVSMAQDIGQYQKEQEQLLESIIKLIAEAIDAKSPYTSGHCERVPIVATMLLEALNESEDADFLNDKISSKDELRAFEIGAWLHDCGKVTTPEYIVDKSVKLESIYNRIHEIRTRFEVILRDRKIALLEAQLPSEKIGKVDDALEGVLHELREQFAFVAACNVGGEYLDENKITKLQTIAALQWSGHFDKTLGLGMQEQARMVTCNMALPTEESLIQDAPWHIIARENFDERAFRAEGFTQKIPAYLYNHGELYNLSISKGTLSEEERFKINEHSIMTLKMLEKIPFPKELKNVAYYAGTHHEKLDGSGYPRGLDASQLNMAARVMVLADIFEALSASDRPYNRPKKLSEVINIMSVMVKENHIDAKLFRLFLQSGVYEVYAKGYLKAEQVDEVDIAYYCSETKEA